MWTALAADDDVVRICADVLPDAETQRAGQFWRETSRRESIVSLGLRRLLLGLYLDRAPGSLEFVEGPHGKPALCDGAAELNFNLSHSCGLVIFAVARPGAIGVDVQKIRTDRNLEAIERNLLMDGHDRTTTSATEDRVMLLHQRWVRNEAVLKLSGAGLDRVLDLIEMQRVAQSCTIADIRVPDGYVGAIAVQGPRPSIRELAAVRSSLLCPSSSPAKKRPLSH